MKWRGKPRGASVGGEDTAPQGEETSVTMELIVLQAEGATVLLLDNTLARHALLFEGTVEGNFVATQTSRGPQPGDWCEERNEDSFNAGVRSQWRRYKIEDVVPAASRQLVAMHFAMCSHWETELLSVKAAIVPTHMAGARPKNHPFAPYAIRGQVSLPPDLEGPAPVPAEGYSATPVESQEEAELQLALQMSLQEARTEPEPPRQRWGRRNKPEAGREPIASCSICCERMFSPSPLQCCAQVCLACASHWAAEQEAQGLGASEIQCPQCRGPLDTVLKQLLSRQALRRAQERLLRPAQAPQPISDLPATTLARLGLKQCPGCGEGLQKESETCHKMICRTCRARFCFRCLTRLESGSLFGFFFYTLFQIWVPW